MSEQAAKSAGSPEWEDIQVLLRFGLGHLTHASFLLLRVRNRDAARAWLAAAPVTSAVATEPRPQTALQVALTSAGLRALGIASEIVEGFSNEYVNGMSSDPGRSRRLGDVAESDPANWAWGSSGQEPHLLLMVYASPPLLESFEQSIREQIGVGFEEMLRLTTAELTSKEPFGFEDGISQPQIDWERQRPVNDEEQYAYSNRVCLGEFLLGYPNEYGAYSDRPLLDPQSKGAALLPRGEDSNDKADLGRNGTYLVMRQLEQDIGGFWQYLDQQADGDAMKREQLAASLVGRKRDGAPLVGLTDEAIPGNSASPKEDLNGFTYESDPDGLRCPLGAHIRRSNPRNADLPGGKSGLVSRLVRTLGFDAVALGRDLVASTRFHRLLRRGRTYGAQISVDEALSGVGVGRESGLYFVCLNANIGRQFEFVQGAWVAGTKFAGLPGEGDPLLGHRQPGLDGCPSDGYSIPQSYGPDHRLTKMPAFVTVRGGAYFFLPGIRALRYLAAA
jgi:deferrochelatase/peroxidase EfeB